MSIITIIAAVCVTIYCIEIARLPEHFEALRRKPFNCQYCLPVWLALTIALLPEGMQECIAGAAIAGIITPLIIQYIRS